MSGINIYKNVDGVDAVFKISNYYAFGAVYRVKHIQWGVNTEIALIGIHTSQTESDLIHAHTSLFPYKCILWCGTKSSDYRYVSAGLILVK